MSNIKACDLFNIIKHCSVEESSKATKEWLSSQDWVDGVGVDSELKELRECLVDTDFTPDKIEYVDKLKKHLMKVWLWVFGYIHFAPDENGVMWTPENIDWRYR